MSMVTFGGLKNTSRWSEKRDFRIPFFFKDLSPLLIDVVLEVERSYVEVTGGVCE
jgi:hypothetical protein